MVLCVPQFPDLLKGLECTQSLRSLETTPSNRCGQHQIQALPSIISTTRPGSYAARLNGCESERRLTCLRPFIQKEHCQGPIDPKQLIIPFKSRCDSDGFPEMVSDLLSLQRHIPPRFDEADRKGTLLLSPAGGDFPSFFFFAVSTKFKHQNSGGHTFVFYHHHLVEFPCSDPLAPGGAVAVWSQAASPRGPGHPREELTKLDNLGWHPAQTSSPLSLILQHPIPRGQGNREPSYPPDPGKVARVRHRHSAKGSLAGVGWRVFTRGQGKIPCSTRLQTAVTRSTANRLQEMASSHVGPGESGRGLDVALKRACGWFAGPSTRSCLGPPL